MFLPTKTLVLWDEGPSLRTSFNRNSLSRGPISKYSHTGGGVGPSTYELLGDTNIQSIPAGVEASHRLNSMDLPLPKLIWHLPLLRAQSTQNTGQCCPVWAPLPRKP